MKTNQIVEYEKVQARNPITGAIIAVEIEKPTLKTPEECAENVKSQLMTMGLEPIEKVEVRNAFTGKTSLMTIDRTGHNEQKLSEILANPEMSRDRKDFEVSMYLYERGAENTSMIVDLMRYKGAHTKETRVFKSQIRFDFEMFTHSFVSYLENQSRLLGITLDIDIQAERKGFIEWLELEGNKGKGYTYVDYCATRSNKIDRKSVALTELAIQSLEEAERLSSVVHNIAKAREQEKGKGIYVDRNGRPYTEDDPQLDDAIIADRKATAEAQQDETR